LRRRLLRDKRHELGFCQSRIAGHKAVQVYVIPQWIDLDVEVKLSL
jgi:hypothetical protein